MSGSGLHNESDGIVLHGITMTGAAVEESAAPTANPPQLADGHSAEQQEYINYAWEYGNEDMGFIYMMVSENGSINPHNQSTVVKNGVREPSWGFCQIHKPSHPDVYADPRMFEDWQWQIRKCYELYIGGTTFYAKNRFDRDPTYRKEVLKKFKS